MELPLCSRAHDLDNNTQLDGLEIYQAIKHTYESSSDSDESLPDREANIVGKFCLIYLH